MTQVYFNPARENMLHSLPDCEVFYVDEQLATEWTNLFNQEYESIEYPVGWYWWACFPGCVPDGEPCGPFDTEEIATADAQEPYTFE